jgi:hypothetical protein
MDKKAKAGRMYNHWREPIFAPNFSNEVLFFSGMKTPFSRQFPLFPDIV